MKKILTKLIVCLWIVSILVLTVGAVNQTSNITENQTNAINESIGNVTATATATAIPTGNATPNVTALPVDTGGDTAQNVNQTTTQNVNQTTTQNVNQNVNVTIEAPISTEEKNTAINIAINFTVNNIGIENPKVVDVTRKEKKLHVRVRDETGENIVIIINPGGEVNEEIHNVQRFVETQNNFVGEHVSFQFNKNSIYNFSLDGKLIFQSINLGFDSTKVRRTGSTLRISDATNTVIIYDNSNGIITQSASGKIESTYTVVPEITVEETGNRVNLIDHIKGSIIGSDTDSVVVLAAGNKISVKINHGKTTFIANVLGERSAKEYEFEDRIVEGIYNNRIGNIINIETEDSHNVVGFGVYTTINKVSLNTVSLNVNSDSSEGRTILLRVGKDIFPNLNLRILVDGNEIKQAKDFEDLFKNDKYAYLTVIGQNVEVLVSIPAFSEHEIVVTSELPVPTISGTSTAIPTTAIPTTAIPTTAIPAVVTVTPRTPGFTSGMLFSAIMIALIFMRRKNNGGES